MKKTTISSGTQSKLAQSKVGATTKITEQQTTHDPALSRSFRGHEEAITSVDFDPKMRQVASASKDSIVYVWNFKPQQRPFKFVGHKGPVYCVKYSPDGETIASCGQDRQIRLWQNTVQQKLFLSLKDQNHSVKNYQIIARGGHQKYNLNQSFGIIQLPIPNNNNNFKQNTILENKKHQQ